MSRVCAARRATAGSPGRYCGHVVFIISAQDGIGAITSQPRSIHGTSVGGDTAGAAADLGGIAPLELGHPAAGVVDGPGLDSVPRKHALGGAADPRIVVLDEAGGVEHGLAPGRRRARIDRGRGGVGLPAEAATMKARQNRVAMNAAERLHERPGEPVAAPRRPVGERGEGAEQPAVAVGPAQRALRHADPAVPQAPRPLARHQGGEIQRVDVRRRVGTDGTAHVAERAGRAYALEPGALDAGDPARSVDQVEEARKALAQVFAAAAGLAHREDATQLAIQRVRVEKRRRLPVDGGPQGAALPPRRGLPARLSRGRRVWTRQ